jgi:hypothetical protein
MLTREPQLRIDESLPASSGFRGLPGAIRGPRDSVILWHHADAQTRRNLSGFRSPQELMELTVLGKDIRERFVDNFIGGGMEKGRVLVDQSSGRFFQANAGGNAANLNNLKQWH